MSLTLVPQNLTQNVFNGSNRNLIQYADFENQSSAGWQLGTIGALTNGLPTGTPSFNAATSNIALSINTASPIDGSAHLQLTASAATTAGNMVHSIAIPISSAFRARVLTLSHIYSLISGLANVNFSGTAANTLAIALYDATNSAFIPVINPFIYNQPSFSPLASTTAQIPYNCASLRICIYFPTASTGAFTFGLKNFYLGAQSIASGTIISDWTSYTPSGSWTTNTTYTGRYRRVGDELEMQVGVSLTGAPNAATLSVNLPSGLSIDTSKFTIFNAGNYPTLGQSSALNPGTAAYIFETNYSTVNSVMVVYQSTNTAVAAGVNATSPITWASGQSIHVNARMPILGWSSSVQTSDQTDGRIVSWNGTAGSQSVTGTTDIAFTTIKDRTGAWNGTQFTVSVPGDYVANGAMASNATATPFVFVNGFQYSTGAFSTPAAANFYGGGSILLTDLKAGDKISLRSGASATVSSANFGIYRLSGSSAVAQSERVGLKFYVTTSGSVAANNPISYTTKKEDTHGAFSGTQFKAFIPGTLVVAASTASTSGTGNITVYKNGSLDTYLASITSVSGAPVVSGTTTVPVLAGDLIDIRPDATMTITAASSVAMWMMK